MLRVGQGDSVAFERLYAQYLPLATAYTAALAGRSVSVGDVTQEVFLRLWNHRREYRGQARVRTYIFAYIHNVVREERRSRARRRALSHHLSHDSPHSVAAPLMPEMAASRAEMNELLDWALAQLTDTQKQALRLYYWEGMSLRQAARSAGCTPKCFESRLSRGRARLRGLLSGSDEKRPDR